MSVGELRASIADVPDDYEVVLDNAEVDDCEISAVRVVAERYAGKALEHHARTEAAGVAYYPIAAPAGREAARLVTSWASTAADVDALLAALAG